MVTNPTRGSRTSSRTMSLISWTSSSCTFCCLVEGILIDPGADGASAWPALTRARRARLNELHLHGGDAHARVGLHPVDDLVQDLVHERLAVTHARDADAGAPPDVQ